MKLLSRLFVGMLLCLPILLAGCGGSSKSSSTPSNQALELSGQWTISATPSSGGSTVGLTASVVSSACQVSTPLGTFSVYTDSGHTTLAATCFIADNNTSQGSISGTSGNWTLPPQGILIGVQTDPVPANGSETIGALFVEADNSGNYAVFDASGTVQASSKSMSGNYSCDSQSPNCAGDSGTFTGTHQ
jgi:hypothetical protein